jgi:hypothetical protein
LNPSIYSVIEFVWIKSTSSRRYNFQKKFHVVGDAAGIYRRNHRRKNYVGECRQNLRWNYFRRQFFTDGKFPSVIPLVLSDFLVVIFPWYIPRELQWEK